jgi:integrase
MATVRKRVLPSGKSVFLTCYVDNAGKRRFKQYAKKKDADAYLIKVAGEVVAGTHVAPTQSIEVKAAGQLWLATCRQNGLERTTIDQYQNHLNRHIVPYLGKVKLSQLTAPLVREFEDKMISGTPPAGQETTEKRSNVMVRKIRGSLGALLADSQERGLIARNVVRELSGKRRRGKERQAELRQKGKLRIGVDIPLPEEIRAILDHAGQWRPILSTAATGGLRASELRGLSWTGVLFKTCEIHVFQRADAYKVIGATKSIAGERTVPIPPKLLNMLREHKLACAKGPLDLVFPTGAGNVEGLSNIIRRGFAPAQLAAGVTNTMNDENGELIREADGKPILFPKYSGLHVLSHFYASWLINPKRQGGLELTPKEVQERMGHSSITVTMDRYGHLFPRGDDGGELAKASTALLG